MSLACSSLTDLNPRRPEDSQESRSCLLSKDLLTLVITKRSIAGHATPPRNGLRGRERAIHCLGFELLDSPLQPSDLLWGPNIGVLFELDRRRLLVLPPYANGAQDGEHYWGHAEVCEDDGYAECNVPSVRTPGVGCDGLGVDEMLAFIHT